MKKVRFRNFWIFLFVIGFYGCLHKTELPLLTSASKAKPLLITHAALFTGNPSEEIIKNAFILIRDGKIAEISTEPIRTQDATVLSAKGKMVLPGLIDAHVHLFGSGAPASLPAVPNVERNATAFLYAGITTVVDMGGPHQELAALNLKIQKGEIAGPRLYYAGRLFTREKGHPAAMIRYIVPWPFDENIVSDLVYEVKEAGTDFKEMIRENKAYGATFSKLVVDRMPLDAPLLSTEEVRKIVDASRDEGFQTVAHIGTETNIRTCLDGGLRVFIHVPYRSTLSEKTIQKMKVQGAIMTPTLAVFDNGVRYAKNELNFSDLDREISDPVILAEYEKKPEDDGSKIADWMREVAKYQTVKFENVRKMRAAGIPILAGSDSINVASVPGATLHRELELLVAECGFTPIEAVASATYVSGRLYPEVTGQPRLGYVKEGLPADLLILNGDFRSDIRQTRNIDTVISKGRIVKRHTPDDS